jgi:4-hydroxy-2,2'-bipyrrole-5-carbaldehyde O-methyltransferase
MDELVVRPAQPGDGDDLARGWLETGRYYAALDPQAYQVPDADGLVAWFEALLGKPSPQERIRLVAEVNGRVISPITQGGWVVAMIQSLAHWLRVLRQAPALGGGRWRRSLGTLLAWRDAAPFVRMHFLAVATDLGLLEELRRRPATTDQLGARLAIGEQALLEAFLRLGEALGELRCRAGRWSLSGRRSKALAAPQTDATRAMVQEALHYDAAVYAGLDQHLHGVPPGDYLQGTGAVIARASRLVEPTLAPWLRALIAERRPRRVLDVGCGTGSYLIHAAAAAGSELTGLGVDRDAAAVELARRRLAEAGLAERFPVRHADIRTLGLPAASFDLVLLFQNIYYFAEDERPALLRRLRELLVPGGALLLASLFAGRSVAAAHYDLLFLATAGCGPLPRRQQLDRQLHHAGFTTTRWVQLIPLESFYAVMAQR